MIRFHPRHLVPLLTLLCFLTLGGAMVRATASPAPEPTGAARAIYPPPALVGAAVTDRAPRTLMVTGVDFTPGGRVEVSLYDASGTELLETVSTTSTVAMYVRDWRDDPHDQTVGFTRAGVISAPFEITCGSTATVRAYDQQTARWSDWLELAPSC